MNQSNVNPDLQNERDNSKIDVEHLHEFLGKKLLTNIKRYRIIRQLSRKVLIKMAILSNK